MINQKEARIKKITKGLLTNKKFKNWFAWHCFKLQLISSQEELFNSSTISLGFYFCLKIDI